ncbi:MAG: LAGLIDADG family homing endonuclease [Candidatus Aenigmarchaeota archaeon]|nr:LAGLIDADG family homing endonuclease [Candidatus Aenigmarchaeota archaeon]
MQPQDIVEILSEFLREHYYDEIISASQQGKKSLEVDFSLLEKFNVELADYLLDNPAEVLELADESLRKIDAETKLKVRIFNLPENRCIRIRNLRAEHLEKLIAVDGIVKRASEVRPEVQEAVFSCLKCGNRISVTQTERIIRPPIECDCGNRKGFRLVDQKLFDARWVVVEEPYEIVSGERPSELTIYLKEDLTSPRMQNKTDPGNRIMVVGVLKNLPRRIKGTRSRQLEIYLDANFVESIEVEWEELEITSEDEKKILELAKDPVIYEKLVGSIAPALYGLDDIKLGIALQMFGGETHIQKDRSRVRGDIHILLVGDPSTAKSALMKVVAGLIPRGRYVSGKGVTGAGLCTTYDTLIQLEDGTLIEIGKFVEEQFKEGFKEIVDGIFLSECNNRKILALDSKELKICPIKVEKCWKIRAPEKLIKITTYTGKEIIVTQDNPLLTIIDGKVTWKKVSQFKEGEFIATARRLQKCNSKESSKNAMYLVGLLAGDGSISANKGTFDIKFHNSNPQLLSTYSNLCNKVFKMFPSHEIYERQYMRFNSKQIGNLLKEYGIPHGKKAHNIFISEKLSRLNNNSLSCFLRGLFDTDGSAIIEKSSSGKYIEVTSVSKKFIRGIQLLLLRFGIVTSLKEVGKREIFYRNRKIKSSKKWVLRISGLENIKLFQKKIGFNNPLKRSILNEILNDGRKSHTNVDVIPNIGSLIRRARKLAHVSGEKIKTYDYELGLSNISLKKLKKIMNSFKSLKEEEVKLLNLLANSDLFWDRIKKAEIVENHGHEYVYDVTIENVHSFVANGLIIHNTATVVRDEEFLGGWILEAGALVMCNRSLIAIDEFEKIEKTDQIALHEAMEQNTISIAKASIVATLPAQTAILAGGNPKLGRFDPYLPIKEQIDVPETLLTRFDLKFALRDVPNPEMDKKISDHIFKARHFEEEEVKPAIEPELFRKYVAYARKNCHPILSREVAETLQTFYLDLRKRSEEGPVAITPRQLESMIRFAEASAKVKLSHEVTMEDAVRAINLMKASLRQFGFEPETGQLDIDRAEGQRVTALQRGKIVIMRDVIEELIATMGKQIPADEIIRLARERGVDNAEDILKKMLNEGICFSPKPGIIEKIG